MARFKYRAYDANGVQSEDIIQADSEKAAGEQLRKQGLTLVALQSADQRKGASLTLFQRSVSLDDLEFFTSELSILLQNGVKVDKCLAILKRNRSQAGLRELLEDLHDNVKKGMGLAEAFAERPDIFDPLYINLVKLGEASGELPQVFRRLSDDLKFRSALKRKIVQSLTYPMVILSICILSLFFIFNYIVPQMSGLFEGMPELPIYTEILLGMSQWMQHYQWFLLAGIVLSVFLLVFALRHADHRAQFDAILLRLPVCRNAVLVVERIRFNSALAMMIESGISVDKAIGLAVNSVKNSQLQQGLNAARLSINKGERLTTSLAKSPVYPEFFVSLLEVGEESGNLSPIFDEIAARSRDEFESWTDKMTNLLEPLLILAMGGIVGSVVVVMLLSIVSVNDVGF